MNLSQIINTSNADQDLRSFSDHKVIPAAIEKNVLKALSFYPELKTTNIRFVFKRNLKTSVMQAQPVFLSLLRRKKYRSYRVKISTHFQLTHSFMPIEEITDEVMIGWIGHELGHILDYEGKGTMSMISFGLRYYFSHEFLRKAEIDADTFAVNHGLGKYIISTKRFILNHADLPQAYKNKISRLYLSPDVIVEQVRKLEEKNAEKKDNNL